MTEPPRTDENADVLEPEQGGGTPALMPWTLVVEDEGWSADLAHGAPLPRVGERVDFIADDGQLRSFRVRQVVHTVQRSATERPRVREEHALPNSTVDGTIAEPPRELRAGLPQVHVRTETD